MFKRKNSKSPELSLVDKKNTASGTNPYIENAAERDDRNTNLAVSRHNWMRAFGLQTALLALSMGFNGYYMTQTKVVPYIVQTDTIGHVIAVGLADKANPVDQTRIIRGAIENWVVNSRRILADKLEQKRLVNQVYARVNTTGAAKKMLDAYYKERDIWAMAEKYSIAADVTLLLPGAGKTYQVEWTETWRNLSGDIVKTERWKANIAYDVIALDKEEAIRANPEGLFVTEFSWSKQI